MMKAATHLFIYLFINVYLNDTLPEYAASIAPPILLGKETEMCCR